MLLLSNSPFELRGVETKTGKKSTYHLVHLEDLNGSPFNVICRDDEVVSNVNKGSQYYLQFEFDTRYNSLTLVTMESI